MRRSILILCLLITSVALSQSKTDYPTSVAEALKDLHTNVALGARWASFGEGSWVKARIHSISAQEGESTYFQIEEITQRTPQQVITTYWDGDRKQIVGEGRYSLDAPDLLSTKAKLIGDDTVPIGQKPYAAKVYQFSKSFKVLRETRTIQWTFWLAPNVPEGELRRITEHESTDPTYGGTTEVKLIDFDVPFVVGNKRLRCYCRQSESKQTDGTVEQYHVCYNHSVPGGFVKKDARVLKNGKETLRQEYTLVDFDAKPVQP
jgi:hypothetical protein